MENKKILLMDDDDSTIESLSSYLYDLGFKVLTAKNGITGLEIVKNMSPDIIISDVRMPGLNGIEFAYIIKGLNYNIPIILISSYDNQNNKFISNCSFAYVQKPIDIHCLSEVISDAIDRKMLSQNDVVNFI